MSTTERYPSDLTDIQWDNIEHLFPPQRQPPGKPGRHRTYPRREVVNAVFYLARAGCAWRMLPHDFPPWKTVSCYFCTWPDQGIWEDVHHLLRVRLPSRCSRCGGSWSGRSAGSADTAGCPGITRPTPTMAHHRLLQRTCSFRPRQPHPVLSVSRGRSRTGTASPGRCPRRPACRGWSRSCPRPGRRPPCPPATPCPSARRR